MVREHGFPFYSALKKLLNCEMRDTTNVEQMILALSRQDKANGVSERG